MDGNFNDDDDDNLGKKVYAETRAALEILRCPISSPCFVCTPAILQGLFWVHPRRWWEGAQNNLRTGGKGPKIIWKSGSEGAQDNLR